ncbi:hypothetical protein SUGI_0419440 [Cryptomeria japonica]|nr:hypothetical protein SUGI_0419440 [Cryptomeria japonica]
MTKKREFNVNSKLLASDALLLPLGLANKFFFLVALNIPPTTCGIADKEEIVVKKPEVQLKGINIGDNEDGDIAAALCNGTIASYSLETSLGDCKRAASVRRRALEIMTGRSFDGLPLEGFDYQSILGQYCEMPVGYVQIPY